MTDTVKATTAPKTPKAPKAPEKPKHKPSKKDLQIKQLEQEINMLKEMNEQYIQNAQGAFDRVKMVEDEMKKMQNFYIKLLDFCGEQVNAAANAIKLATKGDC